MSTLARLEVIPHSEVVEKLKISYDALDPLEKELFLDIACFCKRRSTYDAMKMFHACGFHPHIWVKVLMQKALITIRDGLFDMHDLVQEMGHYIVRGEHHHNPEKHSRVWKTEEIDDLCLRDAITANDKIEALKYDVGSSSRFAELVSSMKKLRLLHVVSNDYDFGRAKIVEPTFLSDELRYIVFEGPISLQFPKNFLPTKLVVLKLPYGLQKELWMGYKLLPHLLELDLSDMKNLLSTPDFDGLPCLEKLKLDECSSLEEIHPSLGNHKSLVHIVVTWCQKLRKFPAIICMEKLETLVISHCQALCEFPEIKANMDSFEVLELFNVGIQVLPSSISEYCGNLISLEVRSCNCLKSLEGNFHALKQLYELCISFAREFSLPKMGRAVLPFGFPRFLKNLSFMDCKFKDGEILSDIVELSNLQELNLSGNNFSRLGFSLSQLTQLKALILSHCKNLVELPELPSNIATLEAQCCESLDIFGESLTKSCKRLSRVLLTNVRSVIGGDILLQAILQGESHSLHLELEGLEIPKLFKPPPEVGWGCSLIKVGWESSNKLQLPENWYNDFSGFLICRTLKDYRIHSTHITLKHEIPWPHMRIDHESDVVWTESATSTWVVFLSFALLRNTAWWDQTSTLLSFNIVTIIYKYFDNFQDYRVTLVPKRNLIERTDSDEYDQMFKIVHDSKDSLTVIYSR